MSDSTAAWLAKLQRQPWYQKVAAAFEAQQIQAPLWEATLLNEDSSLNPAQATYDPDPAGNAGTSYGLFQLRQPGVGTGHAIAELTDPVSNAAIAARQMRAKLNALGIVSTADLSTQLRGIELAGWNGGLTQDATRQGQLASVVAAAGGTSSSLTSSTPTPTPAGQDPYPGDNALQRWIYAHTPIGHDPIADALNGASGGLQDLFLAGTISALCLAFIAGGFAILAGGKQ